MYREIFFEIPKPMYNPINFAQKLDSQLVSKVKKVSDILEIIEEVSVLFRNFRGVQ